MDCNEEYIGSIIEKAKNPTANPKKINKIGSIADESLVVVLISSSS